MSMDWKKRDTPTPMLLVVSKQQLLAQHSPGRLTLHSVSSAMERLLRLADPMENNSSSMANTLLCTFRQPSARPGTCARRSPAS